MGSRTAPARGVSTIRRTGAAARYGPQHNAVFHNEGHNPPWHRVSEPANSAPSAFVRAQSLPRLSSHSPASATPAGSPIRGHGPSCCSDRGSVVGRGRGGGGGMTGGVIRCDGMSTCDRGMRRGRSAAGVGGRGARASSTRIPHGGRVRGTMARCRRPFRCSKTSCAHVTDRMAPRVQAPIPFDCLIPLQSTVPHHSVAHVRTRHRPLF